MTRYTHGNPTSMNAYCGIAHKMRKTHTTNLSFLAYTALMPFRTAPTHRLGTAQTECGAASAGVTVTGRYIGTELTMWCRARTRLCQLNHRQFDHASKQQASSKQVSVKHITNHGPQFSVTHRQGRHGWVLERSQVGASTRRRCSEQLQHNHPAHSHHTAG